MKKQMVFVLLVVFITSLACQLLFPAGTGTAGSDCANIVAAVGNIQPGDIPKHLLQTGVKQGDEFDANSYFDVLTHISMRAGYLLDYVYRVDGLGAFPVLYARPADQAPYISMEEVNSATQLPDFHAYLDVDDVEQGYFEYVVMDIMARQFYLDWHANYNDREIICNRQAVDDVISRVNASEFGSKLDLVQQTKARGIKGIEPVVSLTGDIVRVQIVTFTKWGGFFRLTYTISREFPHKIIDVKEEELVPYDCGVMF